MTQLFPDVDLSRFIESPAQNGAEPLPPGEPVGVMSGLNASLLAVLANFYPGDLGVCIVDNKLQLSLPIPSWAEWGWTEEGDTASITAASADEIVIFRVPADERAWLESVYVERLSGDNTWEILRYYQPAGYGTGNRRATLLQVDTPTNIIHWPHVDQAVASGMGPNAIMLEPLAEVRLRPNGAGVAATIGTYQLTMRRTKISRALAP